MNNQITMAAPPANLNTLIGVVAETGRISEIRAAAAVTSWLGSSEMDADGKPHILNWLESGPDREELEAVAEGIIGLALDAEPEPLPDGFILRTRGGVESLWHIEPQDDGPDKETRLGPPLHVLGATRDEHGNAWGLLLQWKDPDGRQHTWPMPKSLLVADPTAWLSRLADEGWSGAPGSKAKNLVASYLSTYRSARRVQCVPRSGWHSELFILSDATIDLSPSN